jgi:aldehyde dehydrogenase family 7 protein A1
MVTIATSKIIADVLEKNKINPNVFTVLQGGIDVGSKMVEDKRIPLISFTGSTRVGKIIRQKVN